MALEFTGPLAVASATSRRPVDFAWIALAAIGLSPCCPSDRRRSRSIRRASDLRSPPVCAGPSTSFSARRPGNAHGGQTAALGTLAGAIAIVPIGAAHAGSALFSPGLLPAACGMALFSSALPYSLEMFALTRLPTRTFGVLMSVEPALGARLRAHLPGRVLEPGAVGGHCVHHGGVRGHGGDQRRPIRCPRYPISFTAAYKTAAPARVMAVVRNFGWAW